MIVFGGAQLVALHPFGGAFIGLLMAWSDVTARDGWFGCRATMPGRVTLGWQRPGTRPVNGTVRRALMTQAERERARRRADRRMIGWRLSDRFAAWLAFAIVRARTQPRR